MEDFRLTHYQKSVKPAQPRIPNSHNSLNFFCTLTESHRDNNSQHKKQVSTDCEGTGHCSVALTDPIATNIIITR